MNFEGTHSTGSVLPSDSGGSTLGSRLGTPLLGGMLMLMGPHLAAEEGLPHDIVGATWVRPAGVGSGTARVVVLQSNRYQPRTDLGRKLLALRQAAIAKGMKLVPAAKIVADLEEFRG